VNILVIGDVVGKVGRRAVACLLPELRRSYKIDLVIANGENAAGGKGLTPSTAEDLFQAGVQVLTSGNHIWHYREIYDYLDGDAPVVRPINDPEGAPGRGLLTYEGVGVVNLIGRTFMPGMVNCPFREADRALDKLKDQPIVIVDMHAEATSEKQALGWYLDGRVAAVLGTHTHVPTADPRILPCGTAYISDAGFTGARDSVLGFEVAASQRLFLSQLPTRLPVEEKCATVVMNSVLVEIDESTGRSQSIQRVDREHTF
jgi:hypothetical protein